MQENDQKRAAQRSADAAAAWKQSVENEIALEVAERIDRQELKEYARRNAEASEAALEAERQRTSAAKEEARVAQEEARISRRNMRLSLWFAAASLLVAAWPLVQWLLE